LQGDQETNSEPLRSKEKEKEKEKEKDVRAETGAHHAPVFRDLIAGYDRAPAAAAVAMGRLLRSRREALGVSQRDLCHKVGPAFGARSLGQAERGELDPGLGTWTEWDRALTKLESAKRPANPDHQRFVNAFTALWRDEHGPEASGPTWSNGRHHAALRAALSEHGLDGLLARARNMFASDIGFWPITARSDKDLSTLLGHLDKFVSVRRRAPQSVAVGAGTPQEHRNDPGLRWTSG
jgi:transcriptional regulator with XRE-family HTH domain